MDYTGKTLDNRYHLTKLLGQGGMGTVYLGQHTIIGKQVAVKFLHAEFASNEEVLKRFYREAQAAASIGHKNIIDVMDVGVSPDGDPYLVMEYLEGEDLDNMLKRTGPLDFSTALGILEPALLALSAAHSKGIVHRDLKPANIFLVHQAGEAPAVKLIDFGISKFTRGNDQTKLTQTGSLLGTPAYMSPEQARGTGTIDQRTDLYAMGVILYQMLTNELPFEGENYNDLLIKVLTEPHRPPLDAYKQFPAEADALVTKSLSKNPADRFQTSIEMIESLKQHSAYDGRIAGMTILASDLQTQCCAAGDLGKEINESTKPSATGVLQQMAREGTPGAWAETSVKGASGEKRKGLVWGMVVLATLVIAAVIGVLFSINTREQPRPAISPIGTPSPTQLLSEGQGVQIKIEGLPSDAKIYWDKGHVPMNPFRVKKTTLLSQLRVEATGFQTYITSVIPQEDKLINVNLKPEEKLVEINKVPIIEDIKPNKKPTRKKRKSSKATPTPEKENKKIIITAKPTPKPIPSAKPAPKPAAPPKPKTVKKNDKGINKGGRGTLFSEDFE